MKQADRTKVCWSCEADVNYEATYCPFCGTDLLTSSGEASDEPSNSDERFTSQSLQESLASLYKPPYSVRNKQGFGVPDEREETAFKPVSATREDPLFQSYEEEEAFEEEVAEEEMMQLEDTETESGGVLPLLLLTVGLNLITIGILILCFSNEGIVRLEWSSNYWFLYLLFGLPLSYLGVRTLKKLTQS